MQKNTNAQARPRFTAIEGGLETSESLIAPTSKNKINWNFRESVELQSGLAIWKGPRMTPRRNGLNLSCESDPPRGRA